MKGGIKTSIYILTEQIQQAADLKALSTIETYLYFLISLLQANWILQPE